MSTSWLKFGCLGFHQRLMETVECTSKKLDIHGVIEIDTIERAVHLIPCFGNATGTKMTRADEPPVPHRYDELYINNHVNVDTFKTIY